MSYSQLINIAKAQLNMSEDAYRALLKRVTKKDSLRAMTPTQQRAVLNEMKLLGFVIRSKNKSQNVPVPPQHALILSLWAQLAESGTVRDSSRQALNRFIKKMVNVDALQWLDGKQSSQIIEHLKKWLERSL